MLYGIVMLINLRESPLTDNDTPCEPNPIDFTIEREGRDLLRIKNMKGETVVRIKNLGRPTMVSIHSLHWNTLAEVYGPTLKCWSFGSNPPEPSYFAEEIIDPRVDRTFDEPISHLTFSKDAVHLAVATAHNLYVLHLGGKDIVVAAETDLNQPVQSMAFTPQARLLVQHADAARVLEMQR